MEPSPPDPGPPFVEVERPAQSRRRRLTLGLMLASGGCAAVALLGLLGVVLDTAASHANGPAATAPDGATAGMASTTSPTTAPVVAPTSRPRTPSTLAPPPATVPAAVAWSLNAPIVTGAGAIMTPPPAPDRRFEDAGNNCGTLLDAGWKGVQCGSATVGGTVFTWLLEFGVAPANGLSSTRAFLFRQNADRSHQVLLEARDDDGTRFMTREIDAQFASLEPGANQDLIFAFAEAGGSGTRQGIDVVQLSTGAVVVHRDLTQASVVASPGRLDTYAALADTPGVPFSHDTIAFVNSAWRIVHQETIRSDQVPTTQFD